MLRQSIMKRIWLCGAGALVLFLAIAESGFKLNLSNSIKPGVYRETIKAYKRGDYVLLCPPLSDPVKEAFKRGYFGGGPCPGRYEQFMKKIAGMPGDRVDINADGVFVNGIKQAYSEPLSNDSQGRPLPVLNLHQILSVGEVILLTDGSSKSFDSRYLGVISAKQIISTIQPFYTW